MKFRALLVLMTLLLSAVLPAEAMDRVTWYYGIQPPSSWMNLEEKDSEYALGQLIWDIIGRGNTAGFFTNLSVAPNTGMYVQVGPANANQLGSLYQIGPADLSPFGGGPLDPNPTSALAADGTLLFQQALTHGNTSPIGPLVAPSSGNTVIDLIECQVTLADTTNQTINFVNSSNVANPYAVNRDRLTTVGCQAKLGTPAPSNPATPSVDSGWVAVGTVTVPSGINTITSNMINTYAPFNGFLPAGSANQFVDTLNTQTVGGAKTFTAQMTLNKALVLTGTQSLTTLAGLVGDNQTNPGILLNVATGSNGVQFLTNGVANGAAVTASGAFQTATNTQLTATQLTVQGGTWDGATLTAKSGATRLNLANAAGAVSVHYNDGSPSAYLRVWDGGTTNYSQLSATSLSFSGSNTSQYTSTDATIYGSAILPNIAAGMCLTTDANHHIISAGGACGLSSGTITSVQGTGNIAASTAGGAVTITEINNPLIPSPTFGTAPTVAQLLIGTDGGYALNRTGSTFSFAATGAQSAPSLEVDGGFIAGGSTMNASYINENGPVTASQFNGSGAGLSAGTVPISALNGTVLTSLVPGTNIAVGTGATPTVGITGVIGTINGGTGCSSQCWVDLTTTQAAIAGNKTWTGVSAHANTDVMNATGTATSTTGYGSYPLAFNNSVWASGAPAINAFNLFEDSANNLQIAYNGTNKAYVDNSGAYHNGAATFGPNTSVTTLAANSVTSSGTLTLAGTSVVSNASTSTIHSFQANGTLKSFVDQNGNYVVNGSSYGVNLTLAGSASFLATCTATSTTTNCPSQAMYFNASGWNGSGASGLSSAITSSGAAESTGQSGLVLQGANAINGGFTEFGLVGLRPTLNMVATGTNGKAWAIVGGDSGGFTAGSLNVFDRTDNVTVATLANNSATFFVPLSTSGAFSAQSVTATNAVVGASAQVAEGTTFNGANGYSFKGDGAFDTGLFSTGDGDVRFYSNGVLLFDANSGNVNSSTFQGVVSGTYFNNTSRRAYKTDIVPFDADPFMYMPTQWYTYCYKSRDNNGHYVNGTVDPGCKTQGKKLGYMADDTNALLAGPNHDHIDPVQMSSLDMIATQVLHKKIAEQQNQIDLLEARVAQLEAGQHAAPHNIWWYIFHPGARL